jgi:hypothetical protein
VDSFKEELVNKISTVNFVTTSGEMKFIIQPAKELKKI